MRHLLFVFLAVSVSLNAQHRDFREKDPSAWSLDERLEKRFDVDSMRERGAAFDAKQAQIAAQNGNAISEERAPRVATTLSYVIDGTRNPELFTPTEVFDGLLFGFSRDARTQDDIRAAVAANLGRLQVTPAQFWDGLESVSTPYLDAVQRRQDGTSTMTASEFCRARLEALSAARARFGARSFDWLMYAAVAPKMQSRYATTERDPQTSLRAREAGCR